MLTGLWFCLAILPVLVVLGASRVRFFRHPLVRFCLGVTISFAVGQIYDGIFLYPGREAWRLSHPHDIGDTGEGAAIFFSSFMLPGIVALLTLGVEGIVHYRLRRKKGRLDH